MIEYVALVIFIGSLAVTVYVYFGYPALIFVLSRLRPQPVMRGSVFPTMTLLIPVFNEENFVESKVRNCLSLDYPRDRLDILFVSDGSDDRTEELIRAHEREGIRLLSLPRGGKAVALNAGAAISRSEVLVLTDANVLLAPDALQKLASCFADPDVGGVSGKNKYYVIEAGDTTEQGENLYWRYDQWQKKLESRFGSMFAADGTLYAIRRHLYVPIEDPAQADDIAISARVVLQGYRLVFEPAALAWEAAPVEGADEFRRKIRVTNHSIRALLNLGESLWKSGFYSLELLSHKLVRHLVPFFLVLLLLSSMILSDESFFLRIMLALQVAFYGLAVAGAFLRSHRRGSLKVFSVPYYFCLVNAAAFLGVLSIIRGDRVRSWAPRGT